jgi:transcriptional regulator with XRE-family HTH domain
MINLGHKIRKIREFKNLTTKDMADRLEMTPQGYSRIERNEVPINTDKIEKIAEIFEMQPVELMAFDEKTVFNYFNNTNAGYNFNYFPAELKQLYEDKIKLLEDKIKYLEEKYGK